MCSLCVKSKEKFSKNSWKNPHFYKQVLVIMIFSYFIHKIIQTKITLFTQTWNNKKHLPNTTFTHLPHHLLSLLIFKKITKEYSI